LRFSVEAEDYRHADKRISPKWLDIGMLEKFEDGNLRWNRNVAAGIDEFERIVPRVAVAIEILRIAGVRNDRIRGDKPSQIRTIPPRHVIEQRDLRVAPLPSEVPI
jgi:hypothetical protein